MKTGGSNRNNKSKRKKRNDEKEINKDIEVGGGELSGRLKN